MLPLCVHLDPATNALIAAGEYTGECTGYILITPADWVGTLMLSDVFAFPSAMHLGGVFAGVFGTVIGLAMLAHTVGTVAGFFDSKNDIQEL
jgi:hypothetical protein